MVIPGYDAGMKTAISLPDTIFADADALAQRLGVSRSELYARAVEEYVAKHRHEDITDRLNQVYDTEEAALDPALRQAQARSVGPEAW